MNTPRGIRNNNAGNLERAGNIDWIGLAPVQADPVFYQFTDPKWGVRAMARTLMNYQTRDGLQTLTDIISRWAPPESNNTTAYVNVVCAACDKGPYDIVNVGAVLLPLVKAIIEHENGPAPNGQWYSDADLTYWTSLA